MSAVLPILLVLVVLASFLVAYMSAKTWRVSQVVLVVFVFLALLPFGYLAARTLRIHQAWRREAKQQQAEVDDLQTQNNDYQEGKPNKFPELVGIRGLKAKLHDIARDRGGVWRGAVPDKVDDKGTVDITVSSPEPHAILPKMVLYAFEEQKTQEGGRYLGEFRVIEAQAKSIKMEPNLPLEQAGLERLARSKGPWSLYAIMPVDNAEIVAELDPQERAQLLPPDAAAEFADKNRKLRDYSYLFMEIHNQRVLLAGEIVDVKKKIDETDAATKLANNDIQFRGVEKSDLSADREKLQYERGVVENYRKALEKQYLALRESLRATFFSNRQQAADIAKMQLQAAQAIDARTAAQAKADTPAPRTRP